MLLIIVAAAALLNTGALSLYNFMLFFDDRIEQLNAPHLSAIIDKRAYRPAYEDYLKCDPLVTQTSTEDILYMQNCNFLFGDGKLNLNIVFQNAGAYRDLAPMTVVGNTEEETRDSIYAPYILQAGGGYTIGSAITFEYMHQEYSFRIAGFVEDIMLGAINTGIMGFYLPEPVYKRFASESLASPAVMLSAGLTDQRFCEEVFGGFNAFYNEDKAILFSMPVALAKSSRTVSAYMASMIIVAFAVIITMIAIIVIRFRINDSIRDDIKDLGVLKALGYTSGQIRASIMLQFLGITLAGSLLGIAVSYLFLPFMSMVYASQTGLIWNQGFAPETSAVCLLIILLAVALNVLYYSRRVKAINPIKAIKGEIKARKHKKNYFLLNKARGGLQFVLACKHIAQNLGQSIMVMLIVATVTFASAFGLVFYYNIAIDSDAFIGTMAGEVCSVAVSTTSNLNAAKLREEISVMEGVRKAIFFDLYSTALIDDESYLVNITEQFDEIEGQMLYEGRYPISPTEIVIGGSISEKLGKRIGDTVKVGKGSGEAGYVISGYIQSANSIDGKTMGLTVEGYRRIMPDYIPPIIYIYLEKGEAADVFIQVLENRYGGIIETTVNMDELLKGQIGSFVVIFLLLAVVILALTAVVVSLILYFIIKTMIIRRKRDFGVQKALGFTTFQLVQQISLSFLPVVIIGSISGAIVGFFGISPMMAALFKSIGIMRFDLVTAHFWLIALCAGVVLLSYIVAILVSSKTRKISAYTLVTE